MLDLSKPIQKLRQKIDLIDYFHLDVIQAKFLSYGIEINVKYYGDLNKPYLKVYFEGERPSDEILEDCVPAHVVEKLVYGNPSYILFRLQEPFFTGDDDQYRRYVEKNGAIVLEMFYK